MPLADLFNELTEHPSGHAFTVASIPQHAGAYLGIDHLCRPRLFVAAAEEHAEAPLRTEQVSLRLNEEYTLVAIDGPPISRRFHSLCCEASDAAGVTTFLILVEAFLNQGAAGSGADTLSSFFRSLVRLFAISPSRDVDGERQGLWGELFVMRLVRGYAFWARFWHTDPSRRFDFTTVECRLEVKTTVGGPRIHHFSHRQVYALPGEEIVIASLVLREGESGLSLRQLIEEYRASVAGTPDYLKLEKAVRRAAMEDPSESGPIFDAEGAERELAWFRSVDAPHFRVPEPPGVSETHYRVDLSVAPQLRQHELDAWLDAWSEPPAQLTPT